ncbi:MAG TPA: condensation domain-containing protein, partial [Pyrinomonadaceae bacterium]|nr:condensation domain-containing protein [Pyrinomonadaceae bacterium]
MSSTQAELNSNILILDRKLLGQREYWTNRLSYEREESHLVPDHPRPARYVAHNACFTFDVSGSLYQQLKKLTGNGPFLMYTALLVALKITLHKYTGSRWILVGSPSLKETENATPSRNALAIVDEISSGLSFRELLLNVRQNLLEAYARQQYPYERLLTDLNLDNVPNRGALFDITLLLREIHNPPAETKEDLTIYLERMSDHLHGCVEFSPQLYDRETIQRFCEHWLNLLGNALAASDLKIGELNIISPPEREQVLFAWNNTDWAGPAGNCFHELFEEQAKTTPDAPALVDSRTQITYSELNK